MTSGLVTPAARQDEEHDAGRRKQDARRLGGRGRRTETGDVDDRIRVRRRRDALVVQKQVIAGNGDHRIEVTRRVGHRRGDAAGEKLDLDRVERIILRAKVQLFWLLPLALLQEYAL